MLRTTDVDPITSNLVAVGENSIVDGVDNSKVHGAKVSAKIAKSKSQDKSKGKNLAKFKALVQSTKSGFFTSGVKQAFTKLRQAFIKVSILHHFDPDYYIGIEIEVFGYAIDGVLSQLAFDNLD